MQSVVVMSSPTGVGVNTRRARDRTGISQEELAERSGVARSHIASIEKGKDNVTAETVLRLADALRMSPLFLLTGRDELPAGKVPGLRAYFTRVMQLSDEAAETLARVVQAFQDQEQFQDTLSTALARRKAAESQSEYLDVSESEPQAAWGIRHEGAATEDD